MNKQEYAQKVREECWTFLIDSARGHYIPEFFAGMFSTDKGLSDEEKEILSDPTHDLYWDVWTEVLDNHTVNGKMLSQDGDVWLVDGDRFQTMMDEWNEENPEDWMDWEHVA